MSPNSTAVRVGGTILFWLGIIVIVFSIVLFFASGFATGHSVTTTKTVDGVSIKSIACGVVCLGWMRRLVFLLSLLAGIVLVVAGGRIRKLIIDLDGQRIRVSDSDQG